MKIYKEIVENTANYTQLQLKFLLNLIEIHTRKDELDRQRNRHGYTYLDKERTKLCFGIQKNISDVAKKMITSIMPNPHMKHPIFKHISYEYPGIVEYQFQDNLEKTFNDSFAGYDTGLTTLNEFPNTGYSVRLLLMLLTATKYEKEVTYTADQLSSLLFRQLPAYSAKRPNGTVNQFTKIKETLDIINQLTRFHINIEPIKTNRKIDAFKFSFYEMEKSVPTANPDNIETLLIKNGLPKFTTEDFKEHTKFIAMFTTDTEANSFIKNILKKAFALEKKNFLDKTNKTMFDYIAYQAVLYPHKSPPFWYTLPKSQTVLQFYLIHHPADFIDGITKMFAECNKMDGLQQLIHTDKFGDLCSQIYYDIKNK